MTRPEHDSISIHFQGHGSRSPIVLIASETMESAIEMWEGARHNPLGLYAGTDRYHPAAAGREIARLAPAGRVLKSWNDAQEHVDRVASAVRRFLQSHSTRHTA